VIGIAVLSVVVIVGNWGGAGGPEDAIDSEPPPVRTFTGTVVGNGKPIGAVPLTLFEGHIGPVGNAVTDADGNFSIEWTPRTTLDASKLVLLAEPVKSEFVATPAPLTDRLELGRRAQVQGIVVRADGTPLPAGRVALAVHGQNLQPPVEIDREGRFEVDNMPAGSKLEAFVSGPGFAPRVVRGFRVGDFLVLHVERGKQVELTVHDPDGSLVHGASARPSVAQPFADLAPATTVGEDGFVRLNAASYAAGLVEVFAPGYIPVFVDASTFGRTEAVLWPAREVELRVWDGWEKRGVLGVVLEVSLPDDADNKSWNGVDAAHCWREFPLSYGGPRGSYRLRLPRWPMRVALEAPGYANASVEVPADKNRLLVRMPPLQKRKSAFLEVHAPRLQREHWMVVAEKESRWFAAFAVREGRGRVRVPAGRALELASAGASDGLWLARININPIAADRTRTLSKPALSEAAELIVKLDPPSECAITLVDATYGKAVPPLRRVTDREARFWVRAQRKVEVSIRPKGNFATHAGEFEVEHPRREWTAFLRPAAGFSLRVRDPDGRPVPFADVSVWEALRGGRINLRGRPNRYRADATGKLEVLGLRNGPTPVEIVAAGFRAIGPMTLDLENGKVTDAGTIGMVPANVLGGVVTDPAGNPLAGVRLRTAGRSIRRLELPGGGARDLYDITGGEEWDAVSGKGGAFVVRDATSRLPLLVCEHPDYATTVVEFDASAGPLRVAMRARADVVVSIPSRSPVDGVYVLISKTRALRVHVTGGLALNPLPLTLPVGRAELFIRLRNRRWAAPVLDLTEGEQSVSIQKLSRPR